MIVRTIRTYVVVAALTCTPLAGLSLYLPTSDHLQNVFAVLLPGQTPPEIDLSVMQAPGGDRMLTMDVSDFGFAEVCLTDATVMNIDHAHVYSGDGNWERPIARCFHWGTCPRGTTASLSHLERRIIGLWQRPRGC